MSETTPDRIDATRRTNALPSGTFLVGQETRARIIHALSHADNPKILAKNIVQGSIDSVLKDSKGIKTSFESVFNNALKGLETLRRVLQKQPELTLSTIDKSISTILEKEGVPTDGILDISKNIKEINSENFKPTLERIKERLGATGEIFFLEGCIHDGKVFQEIDIYVQEQKEKYSGKKESLEYWNYSNVLNQLAFKRKYLETQGKNKYSISVSGGAGNMFSALGGIESHLLSGKEIGSFTGTSMGSAIGVLVSIINNDPKKLSELMADIRDGFEYKGITYSNSGIVAGKNITKLKEFIIKLFEKYGITQDTKFSDLPIAVIVNASRKYQGGEQEIFLSGENKVLDSVFASMNISKGNTGLLGDTRIDSIPLHDHSTNIKGNPVHILRNVGIEDDKIIAFDGGYSSERLNTILSIIFRKGYPEALQWDFLSKLNVTLGGGRLVELKSPGIRSLFGYRLSPKLTEEAYSEGRSAYKNTISQS